MQRTGSCAKIVLITIAAACGRSPQNPQQREPTPPERTPALAAAGAAAMTCADSAVVRPRDGESNLAFVNRLFPSDWELLHPLEEGDFGFTQKDLLALAGTRDGGLFRGSVLTPLDKCPGWYRRHVLPINEISLMDVANPAYEVRGVLRANADRDTVQELLLILYTEGRGAADDRGDRAWNAEHNVAVFDWNGSEFVNLYPIAERLHNHATPPAVRSRLRALGY